MNTDRATRAARQLIEVDRMFGVDAVPAPPVSDVERRLNELRERHDRECPHCTVATYHHCTVFGEGNPNAALMFIGEAPGADEDRTGRPFVGRAGQLLERMMGAMGLRRNEVYIANILKSRPPNNATPTPAEVNMCAPYLLEQIRIVNPEVIVALGAPAAKFLLSTTAGISELRGRWTKLALDPDLDVDVMPTYHPAFLLRSYTPENRNKVWSDLQQVMERLGLEAPKRD